MSQPELDALERILTGTPPRDDELELELAALVESVRADAARLSLEAAERLDARVASSANRSRRRPRRRRAGRPRWTTRTWSAAGAAALAGAAVLAFAVSGSGPFAGGSTTETAVSLHPAPGAAASAQSSAAAAPAPVPAPTAPPEAVGAAGTSSRLEQRAATMTLATRAASVGAVSNEIITDAEQLGAIVEHSNITEQGSASLATFSLQAPSGGLSQLIARLSELARVQSLNTSTQDITDSYQTATDHLAASRRERDALFSALARATTVNQTVSLHDRIDALTGRIGAEERAVAVLRAEGRNATLQVTLQPAAAPAATAPSRTRLQRALHTAGDVLGAMAAALIVALAVVGPLALLALAVWAMARLARRRGRERALDRA